MYTKVSLTRHDTQQLFSTSRILEELHQNGRKQSHWAWWIFPTEKEGMCEPPPKTAVTKTTAPLLLKHAPPEWRLVLELLLELSEASLREGGAGLKSILPYVDHDRVRYFATFWKHIPDQSSSEGVDGGWIRDIALQFEAAMAVQPNNKWKKNQDANQFMPESNATSEVAGKDSTQVECENSKGATVNDKNEEQEEWK